MIKHYIHYIIIGFLIIFSGCKDVSSYHNKAYDYKKQKKFKKAAEYYLIAAEKGYAPSQNNLGILYENGQGVKQDFQKAIFWYKASFAQGNTDAAYNLGNIYRTGLGTKKNLQKSFQLYLFAAQNSDSGLSQYNLAKMYEKGKGVAKDYREALYWFKLSAINKDRDAPFAIGEIYLKGKGVEKEYKQAFGWFELGAERGDVNAMATLALCYVKGVGVKVDYKKALYWYKKAALKKDEGSLVAIGEMYFMGMGVKKDNQQAFEWFKLGAKKGKKNALYRLGYMYEKGIGTEKSIKKAKSLYAKAAERGSIDSMLNLGILALREKDYDTAFKFLKQADSFENHEASLLLANLYKRGKGTQVDVHKAEQIYKKLANAGYVSAQNTLAYLYAEEGKKLKEAEGFAEKAENPYYIGTLGWIYFKQKKYEKAVFQLEKAISLFPKEKTKAIAIDRDHLGDVYQALAKTKEAKEQWQKALELTKDEELKKKIEEKLKANK